MKAIQRIRGRIIFCLLLALIWTCDITTHAATSYTKKVTKKNADFTISAEYGLNGLVYYDMPTMAAITIECKENFTGMLQLLPGSDYGTSTVAYGEDISLSAGEAKTFHFVPSSINNSGTVNVQVLDEKGKVVYGESHQLVLESGGSKVSVGVLSDDYSAFNYFDGIGMQINTEQGVTSVFELNKDSFPEDAMGLIMLQYMIIDNYDTSQLSSEQYEALKTWVREGGVLILGLGSNYQNVLHGFQDSFVSGTIGTLKKTNVSFKSLEDATVMIGSSNNEQGTLETEGIEEQTTEDPMENTADITEDETMQVEDTSVLSDASLNMDCLEFELEGGKAFSEFTTQGTAYTKEMGKGKIVVLGYSMGMEPMTSSPEKAKIAKFILRNAANEASEEKFYGGHYSNGSLYSGLDVAKLADDSRHPSALLYGLLLFVYVVLVGPILYGILKAMNKREKIWVAIPLVTLVFTMVIYLSGFLYRINKPLISTFSVVQLQDDAITENVYTNILCPKPQKYELQFTKGYTGFRKNMNEYNYSMFDAGTSEQDYDYMLKKNGKGTILALNPSEPFQDTGIVLNKGGENNIGTLDGNITCYTTGFEGSVTNNTCYDLQDVVVSFENYICLVGDIKKGKTADIDQSKIVEANAYGSFDTLYNTKSLYSDRNLFRRYQANNMIESNFVDTSRYHTGYIWAYVPSYKPEVVESANVKRAGCGVLITSFEEGYADVQGTFYPSIDSMEIACQGEYDSMDRNIYSSEVVITYSFDSTPGITCLENMSRQGVDNTNYNTPADVYAFNIETGDYEQIFVDSNVLEGEELQKYMLNDMIVLRYMQHSSGYGAYIPRISARGEE